MFSSQVEQKQLELWLGRGPVNGTRRYGFNPKFYGCAVSVQRFHVVFAGFEGGDYRSSWCFVFLHALYLGHQKYFLEYRD